MKLLNLCAVIGLLATASSQAATITVAAGLPAQGFTPTVGGVALANFSWAVGTWNAGTSTFTTFGEAFADTGEVNGSVTAAGPSTFNGQAIALFIGTGSSIATSGSSWVVLTSTQNPLFPADVSQPDGVTFSATTPAVVTIVGTGNAGNSFSAATGTGYNLQFVPEPSSALLGLLGVAGLLRRRR
jgi:hypothetical protein